MRYIRGQKHIACALNHHFDEAKEGYLNLLLSHQKNSRQPGDSKEMLQARRRFLEAGHYKPVADKISQIIESLCTDHALRNIHSLLDIGCGEGYYLRYIKKYLSEVHASSDIIYWGIDISKEAVKMAARSSSDQNWLVGNNFILPFPNESLDCLLSVFSPVSVDACARVLAKKGFFIQVYSFEDHLEVLKQKIYNGSTKEKDYLKYLNAPPGFTLIKSEKINYCVPLAQEAIVDLLQMTPHYWRVSETRRSELIAQSYGEMRISMGIVVYQKEA